MNEIKDLGKRVKTVAIRYSDNIAPLGTIEEHRRVIEKYGFAWFGKFGSPIAAKVAEEIMLLADPRILLIKSGGAERYWACIGEISRTPPPKEHVPNYYQHLRNDIQCWLKVYTFERASKDIMSRCIVASSGRLLSESSKSSLSPFFIIEAPFD